MIVPDGRRDVYRVYSIVCGIFNLWPLPALRTKSRDVPRELVGFASRAAGRARRSPDDCGFVRYSVGWRFVH